MPTDPCLPDYMIPVVRIDGCEVACESVVIESSTDVESGEPGPVVVQISTLQGSVYRGHAIHIDRAPGTWKSGWRRVRIPSLGISSLQHGSAETLLAIARGMIDRHIAEHGDAPAEREPMTDEQRAERNAEVFGRF